MTHAETVDSSEDYAKLIEVTPEEQRAVNEAATAYARHALKKPRGTKTADEVLAAHGIDARTDERRWQQLATLTVLTGKEIVLGSAPKG